VKNKITRLLLLVCVLAVLSVGFAGCGKIATPKTTQKIDVAGALSGNTEGYSVADSPRDFVFPLDHFAHEDFRNEWWYFTGNLYDDAGHRFGYQLTFFRISVSPTEPGRGSAWGTNQLWMAHLAVSDGTNEKFYAFERLERGVMGLAGFADEGFAINVDDWTITGTGGGDFPWQLYAQKGGVVLSLSVNLEKDIVWQGNNGLSSKSLDGKNASYYYSITRLATEGCIEISDKKYEVSGLSWLDREWSTSALAEDQAGWDWFSLQMDDGTDIVYFQLRYKDGSTYPYNEGLIVAADGSVTRLGTGDIPLEVIKTWQSPLGGIYPVEWRAQVPALDKTITIKAVYPAQELDLSTRYWEGMVDIYDAQDTSHPIGSGYMELTGYSK
jgi:predicted secreted hydrolase